MKISRIYEIVTILAYLAILIIQYISIGLQTFEIHPFYLTIFTICFIGVLSSYYLMVRSVENRMRRVACLLGVFILSLSAERAFITYSRIPGLASFGYLLMVTIEIILGLYIAFKGEGKKIEKLDYMGYA